MKVGTILHHKYFNGVAPQEAAEKYRQMALNSFKSFGMHGTGIFGMIAKGPDIEKDYEWQNIDHLVDFANNNKLSLHFNAVITGHLNVYPDWYKAFSSKEKLIALEAHVRAVISRYKNDISFFKLVNEVVREPSQNFLGCGVEKQSLIKRIFDWAVDEYPDGRYMINEYGSLIDEDIRRKYIQLIQDLRSQGTRIDIVGEQGHSGYKPRPFQLPTDNELNAALDELYMGIKTPIMITEFDMSPKNGDYPGGEIDPQKALKVDGKHYSNWFEYQGYAYKHILDICESKDYVETVYFWSFADDPVITWERSSCGLLNSDLEEKNYMKTVFQG